MNRIPVAILSAPYSLAMISLCDAQLVLVVVMLLGKLRGLPTHSDIITDFQFREVRA